MTAASAPESEWVDARRAARMLGVPTGGTSSGSSRPG